MSDIDKTLLLTNLHDKVDSHLQEAIRIFQNLPTEELLRPPFSGGWSAAQCFEHLNRYGDYYLPQIEKSLTYVARKQNGNSYSSGWLGSYFIKMMDPATGSRKIKAFKEYIPAPQLDAHAVVAEFIHQQETMLNYLDRAKKSDLNHRIPISLTKVIRLKLGDVLQFVIAHNARHLAQAKRALRII